MFTPNRESGRLSPFHDCYITYRPGRSNEDRYAAALLNNNIKMFAIFDGHGGSDVVNYLQDHLSTHLSDDLLNIDMNDYEKVSETIIKIFIKIDAIMLNEKLIGGSTAIIILILETSFYIINLGDSRAVVFDKSGDILIESQDQTPELEKERIESAGGRVIGNRVDGVLAMARAFGDFTLKQRNNTYNPKGPVMVIPEIIQFKISSNDLYVLLGSDGLFYGITSQKLVNEIVAMTDMLNTTKKLSAEASMRSNDDNTVMLMHI